MSRIFATSSPTITNASSDLVGQAEGFVAKYMGDGVLVYFGYPRAHEDDAERAVMTALDIVDAVGAMQHREHSKLQCRVGIATGLVVVGDLIGTGAAQEQAVVGETPNLAARLQTAAEPGAVVIAPSTRALVGDLFEYRDLGASALKGFTDDVQMWQVLRRGMVDSRFEALRSARLSRLVGREEEIELILRRWSQVRGGEGRVVLLEGEPGIGKSRITVAVYDALRGERYVRLRYFCSRHRQDSALFPILEQVQRAAGITREDAAETRLQKLEVLLAQSADDLETVVPFYADLLGIPVEGRYPPLNLEPHRKRQLTLATMLRQLDGLARQRPILLVWEDAHWIDPTSRELIDMTIERVAHLPVLLIVTYRPEFRPPWTGQPHVTTLQLNRLRPQDSGVLVENVAGGKDLPPEIIAQIVERTDGVPLFVEELTKTVLESGLLDERNRRLFPLSIPASLQASLLARLDRLAPARQVAQIGAAIGRQFSYELALAVSRLPEPELQQALDQLVAAELIFRRGVPPRAEYTFKHALVQDVAYSTMLRQRRRELHTRIALALEAAGGAEPELLAHHFTEARDLERAVHYWLEAGRNAAQRSANSEAIVHLTRGIETVRALPDSAERARQELELQLALGPALLATRGWNTPEADSAYARAQELSRQLGDDKSGFLAVWGSWLCGAGKGAWDDTRGIVSELFRIADRTRDPGFLLEAHHAAWGTTTFLGEFATAHDHVTKGLALYDHTTHRSHALLYGGHDPGVCGKSLGSVGLWLIGYPERAMQAAREGIVLAELLRHAPSLAHALAFGALCHQLRGDAAAVLECGEKLAVLGGEHGLAQYRAVGSIMRGWALAHQRRVGEGRDAFLKGLDEYYATRVQAWLVYFKATLAEVHECGGEAELALAAIDDALALSGQLGERFWEAAMLHRRGTILLGLTKDQSPEAERCFRTALEISRQQQARSIELRAATSLARLWQSDGRGSEARDLLRPLYEWYTEGFETQDLMRAQAVLASLA